MGSFKETRKEQQNLQEEIRKIPLFFLLKFVLFW